MYGHVRGVDGRRGRGRKGRDKWKSEGANDGESNRGGESGRGSIAFRAGAGPGIHDGYPAELVDANAVEVGRRRTRWFESLPAGDRKRRRVEVLPVVEAEIARAFRAGEKWRAG